MKNIKKLLPIMIAVAVIVGSGVFYGEMKYAEGKSAQEQLSRADFFAGGGRTALGGQNGTNTGGSVGRTGGRGGSVGGKIISKDDKSITVELTSGGSRIIFLSESTSVSKSAQGSLSDLQIGAQVLVSGTPNQDGSITAQTIQLPSRH